MLTLTVMLMLVGATVPLAEMVLTLVTVLVDVVETAERVTTVQVPVVPVVVPGHGPLGITLLGLAKSDAALVTVAAKLGPLIADNIAALGQRGRIGEP